MKKGGVRWRHKLWTQEYHNEGKVIDFKNVVRFGESFLIFHWPAGMARMEAKMGYSVFYVWPASLQAWDDGRVVSAEERDELLSALRDWAAIHDPKGKWKLDVLDGHDTGEFDWPWH